MGLNICIFCIKGVFGSGYSESFYLVNNAAASVKSGSREALGGLILNNRAQCRQDRARALVLGCDKLKGVLLSLILF